MKLNKIDYKGKYYILQDSDIEIEEMESVIGTMTKEEAMKPEFVKDHIEDCYYYGIPAYLGNDPELKKLYQ